MNRWFLRLLAVSSLAMVGWSSFSAPIMKTTPVNVMASSVAAAEAVSRFAPSQALELQKGLSFAAELYHSEKEAWGKMLRIANSGLAGLAAILFISSFLPFAGAKE